MFSVTVEYAEKNYLEWHSWAKADGSGMILRIETRSDYKMPGSALAYLDLTNAQADALATEILSRITRTA